MTERVNPPEIPVHCGSCGHDYRAPVLGGHRVLCGDSTDPAALVRLLARERVDILSTDPPYGVQYVGKTKQALVIENDRLGSDGTRALVRDALVAAWSCLRDGAPFYICAPAGEMEMQFRLALLEANMELHQVIAWVKDQFVLGHSDYHWRHESVIYGWKGGAGHPFYGDRTLDTVWEIPRPRASREHPTMKPLELVRRELVNSSKPGNIVLDLFGGSGTVLVVAEKLGRRCMMMEVDPIYVDVILRRWQAAAGRLPVRAYTGEAVDFGGGSGTGAPMATDELAAAGLLPVQSQEGSPATV